MNERLRNNMMFGMQGIFDNLYASSKNGDNFYHLYEQIVSRENILLAYRNLRTNTGSSTPGVDGYDIKYLSNMSDDGLINFVQAKLSNYQPDWIQRVYISKKSGDKRPLGIPTIGDRLIQQCFLQILEPIAEAKFYKHSYGFRPCRSAIHALSRAVSMINRGKMYYCVDVDIKGFFDNVNHDVLMKKLWNFGIRDKRVLSIIRKMLSAPVVGEGYITKGTVQGGIISPLLANIYLTELDFWVSSQWESFPVNGNIHSFHNGAAKKTNLKSGYIVRYADDFKIMCRSYDDAKRFDFAVRDYIETRLKLQVNDDKSGVVNLKKRHTDFLGFNIKVIPKADTKNGFVARTKISEKAMESISNELKRKIRDIQYHSYDASRVMSYNAFVIGIKNYYQYATDVYCDLDSIGMVASKVISNRLHDRGRYVSAGSLPVDYRNRNTGVRPSTKVMTVSSVPMDIINGVAHRHPMNFQQDMTPYTKLGRQKICEKSIRLREDYIKYVADCVNLSNEPVEYLNNRLSRYVFQKGICPIMKIQFHPSEMVCHHVVPKKRNGFDGTHDFKNLVFLYKPVHMLIHATDDTVIVKYLQELKLDSTQMKRVNDYRVKLGNKVIVQWL